MKAPALKADEPPLPGTVARARWASAIEILLLYAAILLYIWRWQFSVPWLWVPMLVAVVASQILHRDSLRSSGLTAARFGQSSRIIFPLAAIVFTPLVLFGLIAHRAVPHVSILRAVEALGAYAIWCAFQQYLTQSYFHRRLMGVVRTPWLNSILVGVLFASAHIPNPILMPATFVGGVVFAEVFRRRPNIWPLAIVQAVGGFLIAWVSPQALIHNMRVGPGYFNYRPR